MYKIYITKFEKIEKIYIRIRINYCIFQDILFLYNFDKFIKSRENYVPNNNTYLKNSITINPCI